MTSINHPQLAPMSNHPIQPHNVDVGSDQVLSLHTPNIDIAGGRWYDASLSGNHGSISGAIRSTDMKGVYFDGVDDYISCGKILGFQENTTSLWYNTSDTKIKNGLFDFDPTTTRGNFILNLTGNGQPILYLGDANYTYFEDISGYTDGKWHNLVLYIAGSADSDILSATLTIDRVDIPAINANSGGAGVAWTGCRFGKTSYGNFAGSIDQIRIYDRHLSESEILLNYNQSKGFYQ